MYKKKLTYSFFTVPLAVISYNVYDWQRRRMLEKNMQIQTRTQNVVEDSVDIQNLYSSSTKFPWIGLNVKQINERWAFKPIELNGQFDHSQQILIERNRQGEEGYDVVTPFYCYLDENNNVQPVLVNRGWIPYDNKTSNLHLENSVGPITIKGCVYKGDTLHKYSKENDINSEKWVSQKPYEIANYLYLPNREISSQFIIKQIEFNPINRTSTPIVYNVSELGHFPISPETNMNYANLWKSITFLNIFSNLLIWVYF